MPNRYLLIVRKFHNYNYLSLNRCNLVNC